MHKPEKNGQEQNTITPDKSDQSSFFRIQFNKPPHLVLMSGN